MPSEALIVANSATMRTIIKRVLADSIFEIDPSEAADGDTALSYCEHGRFDVTFLDSNMPRLDGLATLSCLRSRAPEVKVVMMSSERNEDRRNWALAHGATTFLQKPFFPVDIDRELHAIFGLSPPGLAEIEPLRIGKADAEPAMLKWA